MTINFSVHPSFKELSVIDKLKFKDYIKSYKNITDGEIISINPDPLNNNKNVDVFESLMKCSISSNQV